MSHRETPVTDIYMDEHSHAFSMGDNMILLLKGVGIGSWWEGAKKSYMLQWFETLQRATLHNQIDSTLVELN